VSSRRENGEKVDLKSSRERGKDLDPEISRLKVKGCPQKYTNGVRT